MAYDNVILFGAGASADAGIPLLKNFVHKMWELAIRGKIGDTPIPPNNLEILKKAQRLRVELERYHSRARFDDLNIEDLLSIISFDALEKGSDPSRNYDNLVRAIAVTIEICCSIKHVDVPPDPIPDSFYHGLYGSFWSRLFKVHRNNLPAIVTFNYDLVLERSLWRSIHQLHPNPPARETKSIALRYNSKWNDFAYDVVPHSFRKRIEPAGVITDLASGLRPQLKETGEVEIEIPYLKLHGSLNWEDSQVSQKGLRSKTHLTEVVDNPYILPPVFSKMGRDGIESVWLKALEVIRNAKRIFVLGYSMPATDIYMQHFLKAAVGPNSNLDEISVFDPILYQDGSPRDQLIERYSNCFADSLKRKTHFRPASTDYEAELRKSLIPLGSFAHFCHALQKPDFFFIP